MATPSWWTNTFRAQSVDVGACLFEPALRRPARNWPALLLTDFTGTVLFGTRPAQTQRALFVGLAA